MRRKAVLLAVLLVVAATPAGVAATAGGAGSAGVASGTDAASSTGATGSAASVAGTAATLQTNCSFPVTETDATGTEVTVEQKPERVTTLGPSAAQTMWEIGGKAQVVGVTQYADYLDGAQSRTNVSAAGQGFVNVEKVVGTNPDLVLAPNIIPNETVRKLRDAGLTVYRFEDAASVEDIYAKTNLTGRLTGNCAGAAETVSWMQDRIGTVREAVEGEPKPRVLISQGGGWTAGNGTFLGNLVELAGGTNVAAEANVSGYQKISGEVVVKQNPEYIVQVGQFGVYPKTDAYNATDAVKQGNVVTIDDNYASQPAPRVVYPIVKMAKAFHPEAYAAANATTTASGTTAAAMNESTETATAGGAAGSIPGFGVGAALAALSGAALLAGRR
ncbi:PGF-CTERM-anchored ABC transporter substrate-binding protein [Halorussus vallis]|uniref:PGF-CTERM-anchored ABC transporter substrate-binding protein n=1 Tax=Halorussus vallis TaxID=2953749 RepID=UPI0020A118C0|nr:PGF-CTERM-anchored ABC transporter substrate-binding protein [Halorussus vallis]USZ75913.1 PGF-CTERM-anchored ABC transporter substrate-binding protein [Halorussus vallis]